jgi:hypothetical protein
MMLSGDKMVQQACKIYSLLTTCILSAGLHNIHPADRMHPFMTFGNNMYFFFNSPT